MTANAMFDVLLVVGMTLLFFVYLNEWGKK